MTYFYLLENKENPVELMNALSNIWRDGIGNNDTTTIQDVIINLNKTHGLDICDITCQALDSGMNFWTIFSIIEKTFPYLNHNLDTTFSFLRKSHEFIKNNLMQINYDLMLSKLIDNQQSLANALLEKLSDKEEPSTAWLMATIYINLSKTNIESIHKDLLLLLSHQNQYIVKAAIFALGKLDYHQNISLIDNTLEAFDILAQDDSIEIVQILTIALGELLKIDDKISKRLLLFMEKNDPGINYQISSSLLTQVKANGNEQWFQELLFNLASTKCQYVGIIENIDCVLFELMQNQDHWVLVEEFISNWIIQSDYQHYNGTIDSLFKVTVRSLLEQPKNRNQLITTYFNNDNHLFHKVAFELIHDNDLHTELPVYFDSTIIQTLNNEDILFICRKVLGGYIYKVNTISSLIFSIIEAKPEDVNLKSLISEIFIKHIGKAYPQETLEFLCNKATSNMNASIQDLLENIISIIESIQTERKKLPQLKELSVSSKYSYQIAIENRKLMNQASEEAGKKSFISSISRKILIKYGKGSFHSISNGKYSQINKLTEFSVSAPLPTSEIFYPINAALTRVHFNMAKRGEI